VSDSSNKSTRQLMRWMLAGYLAVPATGGLLFEAVLKETPEFWRNDGGWPIAFRHWVLYSFYPSFFLLAAFLLYLSIGAIRHVRFVRNHPFISMSPLLLAWLVLVATGLVVINDNLGNLLAGEALHAP